MAIKTACKIVGILWMAICAYFATSKIWLVANALAILCVARGNAALSDQAINRLVSAAISVWLWFQGANGGPIRLEFDDGVRISDCHQYAELEHSFELPGVHILTAQCKAAGNPITAKIKVVVKPAQ
jgi:hypothetical protein